MRKSIIGVIALLGLMSAFAVTIGCGGGGSGGAGGGSGGAGGSTGAAGMTGTAMEACNAYCDTYAAAACPSPVFTSAAQCKSNECALPTDPAACLSATKAYYDCERTQADICADTGCVNENADRVAACP